MAKSHRFFGRLVRWLPFGTSPYCALQLRKAVLEDAVDPNDLKLGKPGIMEWYISTAPYTLEYHRGYENPYL